MPRLSGDDRPSPAGRGAANAGRRHCALALQKMALIGHKAKGGV